MSKNKSRITLKRLEREDFASDASFAKYDKMMHDAENALNGQVKAKRKSDIMSRRQAYKLRVSRQTLQAKLEERDRTCKELRERASRLYRELLELKKKIKQFYRELQHKLNVTSKNSNKPPSADSHYHKVHLDKLAKENGLGNLVDPPPPGNSEKTAESNDNTSQEEPRTSETSSSSTKEAKKKKRKAHHPGTSPKHLKTTLPEIKCPPTVCPYCGCTEFEEVHDKRIHQFIDLVDKLVDIRDFIIQEGTCACCGALVRGKVPKEFEQRFGPGFHVLLSWLNTEGGVTRRHLQEFSEDFLGVPISQGGIQNILRRVSEAILPHYDVIGDCARRIWYNHMDETSCPTFGPRGSHVHWLWVLCNKHYAYYKIEEHRSKEAFFVVVGPWRGILISDDYGTYIKWEYGRQTCLAHLKRVAKKLSEHSESKISNFGKWIHDTIKELLKKKGMKCTPDEIQKLKEDFIAKGKDFSDIGGDAKILLNRMEAEFEAVTYFLQYPIEPTNNFAEQMLRPFVVARKNSFGTTSEWGERWLERSLSLRMTVKLQKLSFKEKLYEAVSSLIKGETPDLKWLQQAAS